MVTTKDVVPKGARGASIATWRGLPRAAGRASSCCTLEAVNCFHHVMDNGIQELPVLFRVTVGEQLAVRTIGNMAPDAHGPGGLVCLLRVESGSGHVRVTSVLLAILDIRRRIHVGTTRL